MTTSPRTGERGASAVEYGLLVAGVVAACLFSLEALGVGVRTVFNETNSNVSGETYSSTP